MIGINPEFDWRRYGGNALQDVGVGFGQAPTIWGGLAAGAQRNAALQPARDEAALAEAQRKRDALEKNQTSEWIKANYPQYANLPVGQAWQAALGDLQAKRDKPKGPQYFNVGDGTIVGVDNGKASVIYGGGESGGTPPPYDGTSMDAQNWNIILTGDPSSPKYAAAYSQLSQPKMTLQQTEQGMVPVWTSPQLPANIRPPTGMQAPTAGTPAATGQPGGGVSVGGALPGTQKAPTEQRARAKMMDSVISPEVARLLGDGKTPGTFEALGNGWDVAKDGTGTAGRFVPFGMGTPSENFLKAKSAVRTIIASYLYVASGATANPGEVENQAAVLTPQVNDPPDVVKDKKARLQAMADAVKALARGDNVDLGALSVGGDVMSQADALLNSGKYN